MMTIKKQWSSGTGEVTINYDGSGNGQIAISSDDNNLYEARSMQIVVQTTVGSPQQTKTVNISQAARVRTDISNAVVTAANQTYSGSAKTPAPTVVLNGTTIPSTGYDVTYNNNTNAGTATVTVTGKGDYTGTASGTFTIAKANPVYVAPTANNRTYDTTSKALLVAGSNTTPGAFTYCSTQSGTYSTIIPSKTNAGSYTTWWKFTPTDTNNYNTVGPTSIGTTVSPKTVSSPTITLSQSSYTYTGNACQPTPTVKDGSTTISSSEYTVSYSDNVNAGTGTVTITDNSSGNYTVSGSKTFTINKADPTYTAPSATNPTYSGSSQYLHTAGSTSHGTLYYSTNGSNWYTSRRTGTNAGSYNVYWKLTGDSNHNDVASTQISGVTIAQKALTITAKAQSISYGSSIATGTGQVTTSGLVSSDSLTAITLTASTSNVTTSGTITPSAASTTKGASNYSITYATGNLTITAVPASVTAAPTAKSLTYSRSAQNLVNAGSASGGTMYYKYTTTNSKPSSTSGFSSSVPTRTNAGTYYVWYYVKGDSNHTDTAISSTAVTVTIAKATPVVATTPSKRSNLTYSGSAQNLLSGGSMKHSSSDSTSVSGTFTYKQGTNAGTYSSLTWSFAPTDSTNYNSASGTVSGSVSIAKASRTISFTSAPTPIDVGESKTLAASVSAGGNDGTITFSSSNTSRATISGTTITGVSAGNVTVTASISEGTNYLSASTSYTATIVVLNYVDMGLPSGLLWAKKNVDVTQSDGFAASEYQYECSFFSWGNIDGHNPTSPSSFSPYSWGTSINTAPYSTSPGASISYPSSAGLDYDAARAACGAPWRLPSSEEFGELFSNSNYIDANGNIISSTNKLTTMNGIVGIRLKSKINGNVLFFPCSGGADNGSTWSVGGTGGLYWSSSLGSNIHGRFLYFNSQYVVPQNTYGRYCGFAVRPVM